MINGSEADLRDIPELCLPLTALAALASGPSAFTGVGHTRAQETDRLAAIAKEVNALGGDVTELPDGWTIRPRPLRVPAGHAFESYDDPPDGDGGGCARAGPARHRGAGTVRHRKGKTFPGFTELWEAAWSGE